MAQAPQIVPGERGTVIWEFRRLNRVVISALLNDLVRARHNGFTKEECDRVQDAINDCANVAADLPDGSILQRTILSDMEKFLRAYIKWNNHDGTDEKTIELRNKHVLLLRKKRQNMARRTARNLYALENELDLEQVRAQYEAMAQLTRSLPQHFEKLAEAIGKVAADDTNGVVAA